jgi:hypothetical protein
LFHECGIANHIRRKDRGKSSLVAIGIHDTGLSRRRISGPYPDTDFGLSPENDFRQSMEKRNCRSGFELFEVALMDVR